MIRKRRSPFTLFAFQDIVTSVMGIMILVTLLLALELVEQIQATPAVQNELSLQQLQAYHDQLRHQVEALQGQVEQQAAQNREIHDRQYLLLQIQSLEEQYRVLQRENTALQQRLQQAQEAHRKLQRQAQQLQQRHAEERQRLAREIRALQRRLLQQKDRVFYKPVKDFDKKAWMVEASGRGVLVGLVGVDASPLRFATVEAFLHWVERTRDPAEDYFLLVFKPSGAEAYQKLRTTLQERGFPLGLDLLPEQKSLFSRPSAEDDAP